MEERRGLEGVGRLRGIDERAHEEVGVGALEQLAKRCGGLLGHPRVQHAAQGACEGSHPRAAIDLRRVEPDARRVERREQSDRCRRRVDAWGGVRVRGRIRWSIASRAIVAYDAPMTSEEVASSPTEVAISSAGIELSGGDGGGGERKARCRVGRVSCWGEPRKAGAIAGGRRPRGRHAGRHSAWRVAR